jgi:RimJ/RimL family protein N-acetyltransferase
MALAFDPAQAGWVVDPPGGFVDDAAPEAAGLSGRAPLSFRSWTTSDLPVFRALLDDPAVWAHLPEPYPAPLTAALAADLIALSALPHHRVCAILWHGTPVGQVRLDDSGSGAADEAELSYWLGRAHWGRGIGTRAVRRAVAEAFADRPDLTRLTARVRPANTASARILADCGFHPDGTALGGWNRYRRDR